VNGHPSDELWRRDVLVDALYTEASARLGTTLIRTLVAMTADRPVYIVARDGLQKAILERRPFIRKVAESSDWAVFALEKD
jgi:hypothetical protein